MIEFGLFDFRHPDKYTRIHLAGPFKIETLLAEDTGCRQVVLAKIFGIAIYEVDFLIFLGLKAAESTCVLIPCKHLRPQFLQMIRRPIGSLGIARVSDNAQCYW